MGKIGDLWVRLGLKNDQFKKGIEESKAEAESFGGKLTKIKGIGVWTAIGAGVAKLALDFIKSSQKFGDAWDIAMSKMKASWGVFVQSLNSWNWDDFFGRMKKAAKAAGDLTATKDAEFEVENSLKLRRAGMEKELELLRIQANNQKLSYKEREDAAKAYIAKVEPIYAAEEAYRKKLAEDTANSWLADMGMGEEQQTKQNRDYLRKFLEELGTNQDMVDRLKDATSDNKEAYERYLKWVWESADKNEQDFRTLASKFYEHYQTQGGRDKAVKDLVDALAGYDYAKGALEADNRRIFSSMNSAGAMAGKEFNKGLKDAIKDGMDEVDETIIDSAPDLTEVYERLGGIDVPDVRLNVWANTDEAEKGLQAVKKEADAIPDKTSTEVVVDAPKRIDIDTKVDPVELPPLPDAEIDITADTKQAVDGIDAVKDAEQGLKDVSINVDVKEDAPIELPPIPDESIVVTADTDDAVKGLQDVKDATEDIPDKVRIEAEVAQDKLPDIADESIVVSVDTSGAVASVQELTDAIPDTEKIKVEVEIDAPDLGNLPYSLDVAKDATMEWLDGFKADFLREYADFQDQLNETPLTIPTEEVTKDAEVMRVAIEDMMHALEDGLVGAFGELADAIAGVEDADFGSVVKALVSPLADMAIKAGTIILASGEAIEAVKKSLESLNGIGAVVAGAGLVAIGVALKAGMSAIAKGGSAPSATTAVGGGTYADNGGTMTAELVVNVVGTIHGSDIIISGQNTLNEWGK